MTSREERVAARQAGGGPPTLVDRRARRPRGTTKQKAMEQRVRAYAQRLAAFREINRAVLAAQSSQNIARAAMRHVAQLIPCPWATVVMFDFEANAADIVAARVQGQSWNGPPVHFSLDAYGLADEVRAGTVRIENDTGHGSAPSAILAFVQAQGLRSYVGVPLLSHGEVIGSLNLGADRVGAFADEDVEIAREVADVVAVAMQRARLFERVRASGEQLQTLSRRLLETQEAERRHIARELHDEIGQALTAVKINLETAGQVQDAVAVAGLLRDTIAVVQQVLDQVRGLSLDLRPILLDDLGLVAALRWYVGRQAQRAGLVAHFVADPPHMREPSEVETACFRVAQEALTNVVRHARARRVAVDLQQRDGALHLAIRDDGVGFDVRAAQDRARCGATLGLLGMQERVLLTGGEVEIHSSPGGGTEIRAWFPRGAGKT